MKNLLFYTLSILCIYSADAFATRTVLVAGSASDDVATSRRSGGCCDFWRRLFWRGDSKPLPATDVAIDPALPTQASPQPIPPFDEGAGVGVLAGPGSVLLASGISTSKKLMGIEVETPSVKVYAESMRGFRIMDIHPWVLELDTPDATFKDTDEARFEYNLECKTVGGCTKEVIVDVAEHIQKIMTNLFRKDEAKIDVKLLQDILGKPVEYVRTEKMRFESPIFQTKSNRKNPTVRIQITYQLPLSQVGSVFQRLKDLGHKDVSVFMASLVHIPDHTSKSQTNSVLRVEKDTLKILIERGNLSGFSYLFLYYWHALFNNKTGCFGEIGLKKYLGIMSRVPLSQIYDSLLLGEQDAFCKLMDPIMDTYGEELFLRTYGGIEGVVSKALTLKAWYKSVVDQKKRKFVRHAGSSLTETMEGRMVDLLSPPPELSLFYSMGVMDMYRNAGGMSLIEVRGYSSINFNDHVSIISSIRTITKREAEWFFEKE